jgi:hypothetical protein
MFNNMHTGLESYSDGGFAVQKKYVLIKGKSLPHLFYWLATQVCSLAALGSQQEFAGPSPYPQTSWWKGGSARTLKATKHNLFDKWYNSNAKLSIRKLLNQRHCWPRVLKQTSFLLGPFECCKVRKKEVYKTIVW